MRALAFVLAALALGGIIVATPPADDVPWLSGVAAQDPVSDLQNATTNQPQNDLIVIEASPRDSYLRIDERGVGVFAINVRDHSPQGTEQYQGAISVTCKIVNETATERGWAATRGSSPTVFRGGSYQTEIRMVAGPFAAPEMYTVDVECEAGSPLNRVVGEFQLVGHVNDYTYMSVLPVGVPEPLTPDERFSAQIVVQNNGNQLTSFHGRVTAPDGWVVTYPTNILLEPGESQVVNITGRAPRDKLVYISEAATLVATYYPADAPGRGQSVFIPMQMTGVYVHPALAPAILMAITIIAAFVFLAILTRRAIEEKILGKPVPPWRIPVEREHLRQLAKSDPDEFYIVRYYLMVEEHRSALLWFEAYKRATKQDRKRGREWYKVKRAMERKAARLEKRHERVIASWDVTVERVGKKRDRKLARLERKLRRTDKKVQRKIDRKHRKKVRKIERKVRKKSRRIEKKAKKRFKRVLKKAERHNHKRAKKGEDPLPLPEFERPELPVAELPPEPERIEGIPLDDSRFAKRASRLRERAARKIERVDGRRAVALTKDRARTDAKQEKLRAKIPPEPVTQLYDHDAYLSEDEVIIEDDRPAWARRLNLRSLEQREEDRRYRQVMLARIQAAKESGDQQRATELQATLTNEVKARREARRAQAQEAQAAQTEQKRLLRERRKRARQRARELRSGGPSSDTAAPAAPDGGAVVDPGAPSTSPPADDGSQTGEKTPRFKARLRKGRAAPAEGEKTEAVQSDDSK